MKVLIVEDDPVSAAVLKAAVVKLGHDIVIAKDGVEGWEKLEAENLRLVISDWDMPRMDGLALCRTIRNSAHPYVFFILLTHLSTGAGNKRLAIDAGVDDFLGKPVATEELSMRLRMAERVFQYESRVRELESILPMCGYCSKVRDDDNYWEKVEEYLTRHTRTKLSHGVCPSCYVSIVAPELRAAGIEPPPYGSQA